MFPKSMLFCASILCEISPYFSSAELVLGAPRRWRIVLLPFEFGFVFI